MLKGLKKRGEKMQKCITKICVLLAVLLSIPIILTGCWNRRELDTLGIVLTMAFDKEDEDIKITAEVVKLQRGEGGKSSYGESAPVKYVQGKGKTVFDALRDITLKFDRKIFMAHIKTIILSEDIAKNNMSDILDITQREHEIRETTYLFVSKHSKAEDALGSLGGVEEIPAISFEDIIKNQKYNGKSVAVQGFEYYRTLFAQGIQPVIGVIQLVPKHKFRTSGDNKEEYEANIEGSAVMKDNKFVGYLNGIQTYGYNLITNHVHSGSITSQNNTKRNAVEILSAHCDKSVDMHEGKFNISVSVTMKGILQEVSGSTDINSPKKIENIEKANSEELKKIIEEAINAAQKNYNADIFGFGKLVHQKYPRIWRKVKKDWNKIFADSIITVQTKTEITKTGVITLDADTLKEKANDEQN